MSPITELNALPRARTLRDMARARSMEAGLLLARGDLLGWQRRTEDTRALLAEARRLEEHQRRLDEERARVVAAVDGILRRAKGAK